MWCDVVSFSWKLNSLIFNFQIHIFSWYIQVNMSTHISNKFGHFSINPVNPWRRRRRSIDDDIWCTHVLWRWRCCRWKVGGRTGNSNRNHHRRTPRRSVSDTLIIVSSHYPSSSLITIWCQWVINIVIEFQILRRLTLHVFIHSLLSLRQRNTFTCCLPNPHSRRTTVRHSRVAVFKSNCMSRLKLKVLILLTEHRLDDSFIHPVIEWAAAGWSEWHASWRTPIAKHSDEGDWWTHEEMESMFLLMSWIVGRRFDDLANFLLTIAKWDLYWIVGSVRPVRCGGRHCTRQR